MFRSLLATAGARLLLTLAELQAKRAGIDWTFCDTDSMAFACPPGMDFETFVAKVREIREWFEPLNPWPAAGPFFKLEAVNGGIA